MTAVNGEHGHAYLSTAVRATIEARLEVARAANTGAPWNWWRWAADRGFTADADLIRTYDPATVIRQSEALLRILDRHAPIRVGDGWVCDDSFGPDWSQHHPWPCPDVTDIAAYVGVDVGGGQ